MRTLGQDLRYALRGLLQKRGFAAVVILTIGIGIGANTTVFSWMHDLLLNPLPGAAEPDRVVAVESVAPNGEPLTTSYLDYCDFRDRVGSFAALSAIKPTALAVGEDRSIERVYGELVSGSYFDVMRVRPEIGRFFFERRTRRHPERARRRRHQPPVLELSLRARPFGHRRHHPDQPDPVHDHRRGAGRFSWFGGGPGF